MLSSKPSAESEIASSSTGLLPGEKASAIVWKLAWPAVALNSLQVINTLIDRWFIGHLPKEALAAHGTALTVMFLMFSLAMAIGTGATALVSRAFGAGKTHELKMSAKQALSLAIIIGIVFTGLGLLGAAPSARFFVPPGQTETARLMTEFLVAYGLGLPAIYVVQTLAGSLRGIGDTKSPMYISGIQILVHILLNVVLIPGPRELAIGLTIPGFNLGLKGAGIALSLSAWVAALIYLAYAVRTPLGSQWAIQKPRWSWVVRILRIAIPAAGMAILRVGSFMAFALILTRIPNGDKAEVAIAAMSVGFAIESIMFMPAFGLSMAAASLVGQSLGMKRPERAERLAWTAGHHGAVVTAIIAIPVFVLAHPIALAMVGAKPDIAAEAALLIQALAVTEIFFAYGMVMTGAMQGAGDTVRPMWITITTTWLMRVPATFVFVIMMGYGAAAAWIVMSITQAIHGALSMEVFRRGRWKTKKV